MKWYEVISGSDGYYTPKRFKTEFAANAYVADIEMDSDTDIHVSEGPYLVSTDDSDFWDDEQ